GGAAPQGLSAEVATAEAPFDQTVRGRADDDRSRLCERFETSGHIRRLAERELFAAATAADLADHHETGVDADPHGERDATGRLSCVQGVHGIDDGESRAHRSL